MRIEDLEGQESIFAHDSGSGKTSSGRSAAGEILQRVKNGLGQTFKKSSKHSSKLKNHTFMLLGQYRTEKMRNKGKCGKIWAWISK